MLDQTPRADHPHGPQLNPHTIHADREWNEEGIRLRAHLLDAIGHAVVATDVQGLVIYWSQSAEQLYGWSSSQAKGRNIGDLSRSHASAARSPHVMELLRSGQSWSADVSMRRQDGSTFVAHITDAPILADGELVGVVGISSDVTDRLDTERQLAQLLAAERAARAEAVAANLAKVQFLARMSHELRTPLNAIAGYAELLEVEVHGSLNPQQHETVLRIARNEKRLLTLVNDVLDFVRIEAGHLPLDRDNVSVMALVLAAEREFLPELKRKGLRYQRHAPNPEIAVRADMGRAMQVLLSLAGNAVKFTGEGGSVSIDWTHDPQQVQVHVRDTGPGIPAHQATQIFEPFVQLDGGFTRRYGGTGLGLTISRELARSMGGELRLESNDEVGACFTLELPRAPNDLLSRG